MEKRIQMLAENVCPEGPTTDDNLNALSGPVVRLRESLGLHGFSGGRPVGRIQTTFTKPAALSLDLLAENFEKVRDLLDRDPKLASKLVLDGLVS